MCQNEFVSMVKDRTGIFGQYLTRIIEKKNLSAVTGSIQKAKINQNTTLLLYKSNLTFNKKSNFTWGGESAAYQACHIILNFITLMIRKCQDNQNIGENTAATVNECSESTEIVSCCNHITILTFKTLLSHSVLLIHCLKIVRVWVWFHSRSWEWVVKFTFYIWYKAPIMNLRCRESVKKFNSFCAQTLLINLHG